MENNSEEKSQPSVALLKNIARWASIIAAVSLGAFYVIGLIYSLMHDDKFIEIIKYDNAVVVLGIPGAVITAFVLVNLLEQVSGPIKFYGLGFKFEGASGPIIMWVVIFCSLVGAINILWN